MLGRINGCTKLTKGLEYHPMGEALDDTIITTAEKSIEQLVQELAEAGFTGRHNSTKRT